MADEEKKTGKGRVANPETEARLSHILKRVKEKPGITSPEIARELEIGTLTCSQLGDRLVKAERITLVKLADGRRSYYLPTQTKAIEKARAKVEEEKAAKASKAEEPKQPKAPKKTSKKAEEPAPEAEPEGNLAGEPDLTEDENNLM